MANFGVRTTGLPMIIWVSKKRASYGARIKVARNYNPRVIIGDTFSVSISDKPRIFAGNQGIINNNDLQKVFDWVCLNREPLIKYWNSEIMTDDLIDLLKK